MSRAQVIAPKRRRGTADLPIGTIRIRKACESSPARRVIKYRLDGPAYRRWMPFARWWWLKHRGPIPEGLRVLHVDGNTLNDDPSNLMLGTAADNVFLAHDRDPAMSEDNFRRMREGTREHNRLRSRIRRATDWLDSRWYPVDLAAKVIHNLPQKHRTKVWAAVGFDAGPVAANGEGRDSAALGFLGRPFLEACILAALLEVENASGVWLRERVDAIRAAHGLPRLASVSPFYGAVSSLTLAGLVSVKKNGRQPGTYRATSQAREQRKAWTSVVPVKGSVIRAGVAGPFAGFEKRDPVVVARSRIGGLEGLRALASAIAGGVD